MEEITFKERVKNVLIIEAQKYKQVYIDYEYLICSDAFEINDYYIISANKDNYQHLTGIHSLINPKEFFDKCFEGTLSESDFDFIKKGQDERSVKGSVRRKILVLPDMMNLFENNIKVEESFVKNKVKCSFVAANKSYTLGFINATKSYPMTLIKGDEIDMNKAKNVKLLLRKEVNKEKFDEIIIGDEKILTDYYEKIKDIINISLVPDSLIELQNVVSETT
ncbi:MAG: PBECR4 domain-containing protein [Sedimentibacter sp.]